jgi:hypothetical protein
MGLITTHALQLFLIYGRTNTHNSQINFTNN